MYSLPMQGLLFCSSPLLACPQHVSCPGEPSALLVQMVEPWIGVALLERFESSSHLCVLVSLET